LSGDGLNLHQFGLVEGLVIASNPRVFPAGGLDLDQHNG